MFTPQEVSEKVFPKSSGFGGGYQMAAVDEFLDSLTEDYTALFKDNVTLKAKLKVLAEKVEEYRTTEDSMRATLLTAQKMAAKLVQEAQEEKNNIVAEARKDAEAEMARLNAQTEEAQQKLVLAQQSLAEFITRSNELITKQSAFLTTLPEMELAQTAVPASEDTVTSIEKDILGVFAKELKEEPKASKEESKPEPDPLAATREVPQISGIPGDFKLSLDELNFGRNYNGEE